MLFRQETSTLSRPVYAVHRWSIRHTIRSRRSSPVLSDPIQLKATVGIRCGILHPGFSCMLEIARDWNESAFNSSQLRPRITWCWLFAWWTADRPNTWKNACMQCRVKAIPMAEQNDTVLGNHAYDDQDPIKRGLFRRQAAATFLDVCPGMSGI